MALLRAKIHHGVATIHLPGDGSYYICAPYGESSIETAEGLTIPVAGRMGRERDLHLGLRVEGGDGTCVPTSVRCGEFYPRMWRGHESPSPVEAGYASQWILTVRSARLLYARLRDLFHHVEPVRAHEGVSGLAQRELLMLACTEVESAWKAVLLANGYGASGHARFTTDDYVKLVGPLRLTEWSVSLSAHPDYGPFAPFATWLSTAPTKGLDWYAAYNAVKHDRETSLHEATFGRALTALAAVFVMTVAQFGREHLEASPYFHPDEFRLEATPDWPLDELYIGPTAAPELGFDTWTPMPFPF